MRNAAGGFALSVVLLAAAAAGAQQPAPSTLADARAHHRRAVIHFNLDEWKPAAEEFKEAYRLHPDALFLFNIGQCYRKLGDQNEALSYYRKYLRAAPQASNRGDVERRIEELEVAIAAAGKSREAPPPTVIAPVEAAPPPEAPSLPEVRLPLPVAVLETPPPPPPPAAPVYKRWWFWAAVGGAAALGVTAAVLAGSSAGRSGFVGDLPPGRIGVPAP